jgi:hypothetical protein
MTNGPPRQLLSDRLHPGVYAVIVGLACLFAIGAWGFAEAGYTDLVLAVVTGLIIVAIAIPSALALVANRDDETQDRASFRQWMRGEFETSHDRVKGSQALIEIVLPIAAVAVGIGAFAIVAHLA